MKSKSFGELYLTVHDDMRHNSSWIHGRYVHARRKDEKVTGVFIDCSTWFLQPVEGIPNSYHIYIQSQLMGKLYLTVHRVLNRDKRDNASTYVHARRWDARLEDNWSNHSIWRLEPVGKDGYHIVLAEDNSYLTVHHSTKNDLRDENSLYVYTRHKDLPVTISQTDCSTWHLENPAKSDSDSHRLIDEIQSLKKEIKKIKEKAEDQEKVIQSQEERVTEKDLEAALQKQKQYLMDCDTTLKDEVSSKGKNLWEEINSLQNREISSLRKENSQLEDRIKKLEDIIGVDIE